jgi:hydroxypyruvate isomerase
MRYAPHLGLRRIDEPLFLHTAGTPDTVRQVELAAELGFAGMQDNFLNLRPVDEQSRIGTALARLGLAMGSFVLTVEHWNAQLWGSTTEAAALAVIARELDRSIATAARVGGRHVTVTSGRDPAVPLALQHAAMIEKLKRVADVALRGGIVLTVEATSEHFVPGMLVHRIADALAIVRAVDHPAVRLVFDAAHVDDMGDDVATSLEACWDSVAVIQAADNPGRVEPGAGRIDWIGVLRCARERRYSGLVELEHLPAGADVAGERALLDRLAAIDAAL